MKVAIQFDDLPNGSNSLNSNRNGRSIESMFASSDDSIVKKTDNGSNKLSAARSFKIQARTFDVYNPTVPIREEVSKQNYARRYEQMSRMGFQTPTNTPYRPIGDIRSLYLRRRELCELYFKDIKTNDAKEFRERVFGRMVCFFSSELFRLNSKFFIENNKTNLKER